MAVLRGPGSLHLISLPSLWLCPWLKPGCRFLCAPICGNWKQNVEEAQFANDTGMDVAHITHTSFSNSVTWLCTPAGRLASSVSWPTTPGYNSYSGRRGKEMMVDVQGSPWQPLNMNLCGPNSMCHKGLQLE